MSLSSQVWVWYDFQGECEVERCPAKADSGPLSASYQIFIQVWRPWTAQANWCNAGRYHDLQWPPSPNSFRLVSLRLRLWHTSPLTTCTVVYSALGTASTKAKGIKAGGCYSINFEDVYASLFISCGAHVALDFACKTWRNQYYQRTGQAGIRTFDIHTYLASYSCPKFVFGIDADRGLSMLHFSPLGNLKKNQALVSMHYDWRPKIAQDIDSVRSSLPRICLVLGIRLQEQLTVAHGSVITYLTSSVIIITVVILSSFLTDVSRRSVLYANSNLGRLDYPNSTLGPRQF